jgi:hypothetical protein
MRLSEWRAKAPVREALGTRTMAVVTPVLGVTGVEDDPHAWVQWGDDPGTKYTIFVPITSGLVIVSVRNLGETGYRAAAKTVRWPRVQLGDLSVETEGPHRMVSFQLESMVIRGADDTADSIGRFALVVYAAIQGQPWPSFDATGRRRTATRAGAKKPVAAKAAKPASKLPALPARTASSSSDRRSAPTPDRRRSQD